MADTITVASRVHTAVQIAEPMPAPTPVAPGMPPAPLSEDALRPRPTIVINGASHPDAVGGEGITRGVDAGIFRACMEAWEKSKDAFHGLMREVEDDYKGDDSTEFGFEPGIEKMTAANEGAEEEGSTVTEPGPVSSADMDATSQNPVGMEDVPPDQIPNTVETVHPLDADPAEPAPPVKTTPFEPEG
jgi:hypothetical protein